MAKTVTPDAISVILANPCPDSSSDLPEIIVQVVDLKPTGNKYMYVFSFDFIFYCTMSYARSVRVWVTLDLISYFVKCCLCQVDNWISCVLLWRRFSISRNY